MERVTIEIENKNILNGIEAFSAYASRSREAMGTAPPLCDTMQATGDDSSILTTIIESCADEAFLIIARYLPASSKSSSNGKHSYSIALPANYPAGRIDAITQALSGYIRERALQLWYTTVKPDESGIAGTRAELQTANLRQLLTQREKPTKGPDQ